MPALIMLIAGAITCIIDIYRKVELLTGLKRLLIVLVIFYIIGLIARKIIVKTMESRQKAGTADTGSITADESETEVQNDNEGQNNKEDQDNKEDKDKNDDRNKRTGPRKTGSIKE